ncbi:MAG: transporter [Endomicrobiia bacterium]
MKKNFLIFLLLFLTKNVFAQINHFNIFKPYQATLCCPVNVYGLEIQMNYIVINSQTAELQIPVSLYWGLMENLEVGVQFVGISRSKQEEVEKGVGDILVGTKCNFLQEKKEMPIPSVSFEFGVSLPTGDYKKMFGIGSVGFVINWLFEKNIVLRSQHEFNLMFNLGYKVNTQNYDEYKFGDSLFYTFGSFFNIKENIIYSFGVKGENKKYDEYKKTKVVNTEINDSYIFCGISYDLDIYKRFFTSISIGITEDAKDLVFNIGMMY